jgi:uncharacterized cupin superfamily protein
MKEPIRIAAEAELSWEPYALTDGTPAGEVALLRKRNTENQTLFVGMYQCPYEVRGTQTYETNDSMFVLEGEVWITNSDGVERHFGPGSLVSIAKGETATFRQGAGFKKFFVESA